MSMGIKQKKNQQGITLIELVLAIVIVSIALGAIIQSWSFAMAGSANPLLQHKSLKLAQMYSDEILSKRFDETTPLGGGLATSISCPVSSGIDTGESSRNLFDDVDDYQNLSESPPQDINGNNLSTYGGYQVSINISCISGEFGIVSSNHIKRIDVTVTAPAAINSFSLAVYKANF